nr:ATP-binding cassette domain-containing protein [Bradyrhizobium sp. 190]
MPSRHRLRSREHGVFPDLCVKENLLLAGRQASRLSDLDQGRLEWIFQLFPAVQKFWNRPAGKLSGGQKQMVAMARAIVEPREMLLIDEPSKGLAPSDHRQHGRCYDQAQGKRCEHSASRAEFASRS